MSSVDEVAELRRTIGRVLDPLVSRERPCALLDFPNHPNVGDSLIWLGEESYLNGFGKSPAYECDQRTYSAKHLRRRVGDGTLLLTGGGNLGDLWPSFQTFRERVIRDFPQNKIVILPQTIHFVDPHSLAATRDVFDAHPDLTILVRDTRSLATARESFRAASRLCPDMAFASDTPGPNREPERPILWLARTDDESSGYRRVDDPRITYGDWSEPGPGDDAQGLFLTRKLPGLEASFPRLARTARRLAGRTFHQRARERVERGRRFLSGYEVVITDRLHGHILCLLMGIPHVLLDNSYGKLSTFFETWTRRSRLSTWADSPDEALEQASRLLGG